MPESDYKIDAKEVPALRFKQWLADWDTYASIKDAANRKHKILADDPQNTDARGLQEKLDNEPIAEIATKARELSSKSQSAFCRAYGGWYYSPLQALTLDALRRAADTVGESELAIASVIQAASICAASPGHTAQPFKPDTRAAPFVLEAWKKDATVMACRAAERLGKRHALVEGEAIADDAEQVAASLNEGDLAFLDPPYSAVHYSRFYHVLEGIAQNHVGEVSGNCILMIMCS